MNVLHAHSVRNICHVSLSYGIDPICTDIENFVKKDDRFLVRTSFLEIYNEKISDLLVSLLANSDVYFGRHNFLFIPLTYIGAITRKLEDS